MLDIMGKQALKIKEFELNRPKVKDKFCEEQKCDIEKIFDQVNDLCDIAAVSNNSAMAQQQYQEAKASFIRDFLDMALRYRLLAEDCETK